VEYWESNDAAQLIFVIYTIGVVAAILIAVPLGIAVAKGITWLVDLFD